MCSLLKGSDLYLQISPCSALYYYDQPNVLFQDRNSGREAVNQLDVHLPVRICEGGFFVPLWSRGGKRGETATALLCACFVAEMMPEPFSTSGWGMGELGHSLVTGMLKFALMPLVVLRMPEEDSVAPLS